MRSSKLLYHTIDAANLSSKSSALPAFAVSPLTCRVPEETRLMLRRLACVSGGDMGAAASQPPGAASAVAAAGSATASGSPVRSLHRSSPSTSSV